MTDKRDQLIVNMEKENTILSEKQLGSDQKEEFDAFVRLQNRVRLNHLSMKKYSFIAH